MAFDGINIGRTSLLANQLALDTIGRNIANANDPTFARQRVETKSLVEGGVSVRIAQAVNESLELDMLRETAIFGKFTSQKQFFERIENVVNELSDADLSSTLDAFYQALENLSLAPHDVPTRINAVEAAEKLADVFHVMDTGLTQARQAADREIRDTAAMINSSLTRIAELNLEITKSEGGSQADPANTLRDERRKLLGELSDIMNVTTSEQSNGSAIVQTNGRVIILNGEVRMVKTVLTGSTTQVQWENDNAYVKPDAGRLSGLLDMRDKVLKEKTDTLDLLARDLAWVFNSVHNQGRGLDGLKSVVAETRVDGNFQDKALDIAAVDSLSIGNHYKPQNGTLTIEVRNEVTGDIVDSSVDVTLVGDNKTSLIQLKDNLNQIDNLTVSIDVFGRLTMKSAEGYSFFIKEDTSRVSSFLGLNNFFSGGGAASFNVNDTIKNNARLVAAGKSAAPGDNTNMAAMILTRDTKVSGSYTVFESYQNFVSNISTEANRITSLHLNQQRILTDVQQRRQDISGVSLDEEAANLLRFQRSYQASARYISVQDEILQILMGLV